MAMSGNMVKLWQEGKPRYSFDCLGFRCLCERVESPLGEYGPSLPQWQGTVFLTHKDLRESAAPLISAVWNNQDPFLKFAICNGYYVTYPTPDQQEISFMYNEFDQPANEESIRGFAGYEIDPVTRVQVGQYKMNASDKPRPYYAKDYTAEVCRILAMQAYVILKQPGINEAFSIVDRIVDSFTRNGSVKTDFIEEAFNEIRSMSQNELESEALMKVNESVCNFAIPRKDALKIASEQYREIGQDDEETDFSALGQSWVLTQFHERLAIVYDKVVSAPELIMVASVGDLVVAYDRQFHPKGRRAYLFRAISSLAMAYAIAENIPFDEAAVICLGWL